MEITFLGVMSYGGSPEGDKHTPFRQEGSHASVEYCLLHNRGLFALLGRMPIRRLQTEQERKAVGKNKTSMGSILCISKGNFGGITGSTEVHPGSFPEEQMVSEFCLRKASHSKPGLKMLQGLWVS